MSPALTVLRGAPQYPSARAREHEPTPLYAPSAPSCPQSMTVVIAPIPIATIVTAIIVANVVSISTIAVVVTMSVVVVAAREHRQ